MGDPITPSIHGGASSATEQVEHAEPASQALYSASTVARLRQNQDQLRVTKAQAITDATRSALRTPDAVIETIMGIQGLQDNLDKITSKIAALATEDIQPSDILTMRDMKKGGATETEIANWFSTNQTKINRLLNGRD